MPCEWRLKSTYLAHQNWSIEVKWRQDRGTANQIEWAETMKRSTTERRKIQERRIEKIKRFCFFFGGKETKFIQ